MFLVGFIIFLGGVNWFCVNRCDTLEKYTVEINSVLSVREI